MKNSLSGQSKIWIAAGFGLLFAMLLVYLFLLADFVQTMTSSLKGVFGATAVQTETGQTPTMPESSSPSSPTPAASAVAANGAVISPPVIIAPGVAPSAPAAPVDGGEATPAAPAASVDANVKDNVLIRLLGSDHDWTIVGFTRNTTFQAAPVVTLDANASKIGRASCRERV